MSTLATRVEQVMRMSKLRPALAGGIALAAHGVERETSDIDLLVHAEESNALHQALLLAGYQCTHRDCEVAEYRRDADSVGLIYAHRPQARQQLAEAQILHTAAGDWPVISIEGLVAFKLQGWVNNPSRANDLEDIRQLLAVNAGRVDLSEIRGYFELFDCEALFHQIQAGAGGG